MRFPTLRSIPCALSIIVIVLIAASVVSLPGASARLGDTTPYVPDPSECTIEPRSMPSPPTVTAEGSPSATETIPPPGSLVPSDIVEEITSVVYGAIACTNAGDTLRALAYFTDSYVEQMFSGPDAVDYEGFLQYLSTPVAALEEGDRLEVVDISQVRQHRIGLVSAVVITRNLDDTYEDLLLFVNEDGRWLIAGSSPVETVYATPSP